MEKLYALIMMLSATLGLPALKAQSPCRLTLKPPAGESSGNYSLYFFQNGQNKVVKGSWKEGALQFEDTLQYACLANLIVEKEGGSPEMLFSFAVLEPGKTAIADAAAGLNEVRFSGSSVQDEFSRYKKGYAGLYDRYVRARKDFLSAYRSNDQAMMTFYTGLKELIRDSMRVFHEDFFRAHPASLVTGLVLTNYVTYDWNHLAEAARYYEALDEQVKNNPEVRSFYTSLQTARQFDSGAQFPDFALRAPDNTTVPFSRFRGKWVLVDFWASWCQPCREESPFLVEAYKRFRDRGFEIVSVSIGDSKTNWTTAIRKDGYSWVNVADDEKGTFASKMNVSSIPRNFLVSPDGKIIRSGLRDLQLIYTLERELTR